MVAGVHDCRRLGCIGGRRIEPDVVRGVLVELRTPPAASGSQRELRCAYRPVVSPLQLEDTVGVDRCPAAECPAAYLGPERAPGKRSPAPAPLVLDQAALP